MIPLISLREVSLRYKLSGSIVARAQYFDALKSVSLDIYPGETVGVLGRNGAGKSSLLKLISGIIRPDRGKVVNNGASVALLALQTGFDVNLSGRHNAILSGILQGHSRKFIQSKLDAIWEYSELGDFFFEPVRTYSTGMRARLGFAISVYTSPDVLLIDEVLGVGDREFRKKAEATMVQKIQSNQTVVLVTHSQELVAHLCDKAIVIVDGVGSPADEPHKILQLYNELSAGSSPAAAE